MKKSENIKEKDYEIVSPNHRCIECKFQCKVIVDHIEQVNISCKHPKGPGNPQHCIYFRNREPHTT